MIGPVAQSLLPPPDRLFDLFEGGRISREQLQAAMRYHQQLLLVEIAEARRNPILAYLDERLSRHAAARLERRHGERLIRDVLRALAALEGFPPAQQLWNAQHRDVPLHCFFRVRREPVFRITRLEAEPLLVNVTVEHGRSSKRHTSREEFVLHKDRFGRLVAGVRRM